MYAVEKLSSYITRGVYTVSGPFHPFGGAVDTIVVQQQDGSFKSSPWYVRFGKFQGVLKTREKAVTICVNGVEAGFHMYLDPRGEAYFLRDCDSDEGGDFELSPLSSGDEMDENVRGVRFKKVQSCNYDGGQGEPIMPLDNGNGKIVSRTNSRRSRIFGLMFGNKSIEENNQGGNVDRASSLDHAEIAANLLETKWSTNLHSSDHRTDNTVEKSEFDASISDSEMITSQEEGSGDNFGTGTVSREHSEVAIRNSPTAATNFLGDDANPSLTTDDSVIESVGSHGEKLGDSSRPNMVQEVHFEETITHNSTSRTHEEVLEVYTLESGDLGDRSTLVSESVMIESDEYNMSSKGFILSNTTDDAQRPGSMEDELEVASPEEKYDGENEASSLTYTETLQNSTVTFDVSIETHDTLNISSGGDEPLQQCSDVTCNAHEYICQVSSRPGSEKATDGENYSGCHNQNLELSRVEVSSIFPDSQGHSTCKASFHDIGLDAESPQKSSSSESEVIYPDREASESSQGKISGTEPVDLTENRYQIIEEEASAPICHVPVTSGISNTSYEVLGSDTSGEKPCLQNRLEIAQDDSTLPLSESLQDEQFQFSDIESFSVKQINPEIQASNEAVETDDKMLLKVEGDVEEHESEDTNHEECFESMAGSQTSPLAIPRSTTQFGETELLTKSLPIIRSQIHDLERSNLLHPLSCSLDLNSESFEQGILNNDISSSSKLQSDSGRKAIRDAQASKGAVTAVDSQSKQAHDACLNYSTVELSLCKHLLFDNMGADAASRVFEANKVNLEKFSTLGPSLVKNDKLVVRIGRRYFPWDEAAPIILGILCFGQEQVFEPQGMIPVDRDENNVNGDPSGAMVPSGGSWRLWPFSLRKSKTLNTVRSIHESTTQENEDVAPVQCQSLMGHDEVQKAKFTKKKVRSLTPTSEELASLNLKEGQNVITFSFSTAMLGQQQVDARIYLWKWNTRIVISDVDGTITKSDVLGQFMPLVGKDWSQTGVAHLFSAIKENGYQFIFLSARAIAQAYITRQFLFNLKQDGKALPDGPVVISPDGLFPSLFREVIRRAPHEFKIACLEDIRALFPPECNPFYAGFGNRDTDEFSYLKVGVPKGKIFIVNPKGEVAVNRRVNSKSYTSLHALVNGMFPPMSTAEQEDFNSWNYWKLPLPDVDI